MRVLRIFSGLAGALWLSTGLAAAQDFALIYGDVGQISSFRNEQGVTGEDFAAPLRAAGFTVVAPKNRSSANMRAVAGQIAALAADGQVDRLVIVALGPVAGSVQDSWVMSNEASNATSLDIGVTGVSVNALSDVAMLATGPAVILLAPGPKIETLGTGLTPGVQGFNRAGQVSYAVGRADRLSEIMGKLLDPGMSLAELARSAPKGVRLSGFLPKRIGLMGGVAPPPRAEDVETGFWQAVEGLDVVAGYQLYLETFAMGSRRAMARDAIDRLKSEPGRKARRAEEELTLSRDASRSVQRNLDLLGFDPRGIDGIFGPATRAAISAWQRDAGLQDTGYLNGNQLLRLNRQAKARANELEAEDRRRREEEARRDQAYWRDTGRSGDEAGLRAYLERYPEGEFSEVAQERLDEIETARRAETAQQETAAWDEARSADTGAAYKSFLSTYPDSGFSEAARARLRELEEVQRNAGQVASAKAEEKNIAATKVARLLIEQRLAQVGAKPGDVDGKFTRQTRKAIRRFQRHADLPVTGYVSRKTMVRLMGGR